MTKGILNLSILAIRLRSFGEHKEKFNESVYSDKENFVKFLRLFLDIPGSQWLSHPLSKLNREMSLPEIILRLNEFVATLADDGVKGGLNFNGGSFNLQAGVSGVESLKTNYAGYDAE